MGRNKRNQYYKDLHQQAYERLRSMQAFGESKRSDKSSGADRGKIYSYKTFQTYWQHIRYFIRWVRITHPECTTLKRARRHVNEWLQYRVDQGLSNWTIHTECAALCKLYQIAPDEPDRFRPPKRCRADITRSRGEAQRDRHFSPTNNFELVEFARATGTRRGVLEKLVGDDLWSRDRILQELDAWMDRDTLSETEQRYLEMLEDTLELFPDQIYFLHHRRDKGGRSRMAPIIGPHTHTVVERMRNTAPGEPVWLHVHSSADIHGYRADYASRLYKMHARRIEDIPYDRVNRGTGRPYQGDVYVCRADERGKKLDKRAMYMVSKALGHNRLNVVADNYLRGL